MWEEDRTRLLTLHPETWAGMLSNNELSIGYVVLVLCSLFFTHNIPLLLSLPLSLPLFSFFTSDVFTPTTDLRRNCINVS